MELDLCVLNLVEKSDKKLIEFLVMESKIYIWPDIYWLFLRTKYLIKNVM